jgi:signal peptidase I
LLSMFYMGLGQIYCGRFARGLVLYFLSVLCFPAVWVIIPTVHWIRTIGIIALIFSFVLWIYGVVDARRIARKTPVDYMLKDYNRWYVYLLLICSAIPMAIPFVVVYRQGIAIAFQVTGDAMEPTMHRGERILVNRLTYREVPMKAGDIVVLINPNERNQRNIRRVAAMPGDTVEIRQGQLYVNGNIVHTSPGPRGTDFPAMTVPNGQCFVLSDNPDNNSDSRHYGPVPLSDIIGRAQLIYSWSRWVWL